MGSNPIKEIKAKFIAVLNSGNLKKVGETIRCVLRTSIEYRGCGVMVTHSPWEGESQFKSDIFYSKSLIITKIFDCSILS